MVRFSALLSWLAFPLYVVEGVGVRIRTPRLVPPADSPYGALEGHAPDIRLLVLGESSAAGVGLETMHDSLAACLARALNNRTGRAVVWRAAGFNSASATQLRDHVVPNLAREDWTHVLLTIGVNDTKNFHTGRHWKAGFGGLLYALRARFPQAGLFWSEVLPMNKVPAMTRSLAWILQLRADLVNAMGNRLCAERGATVVPHMSELHPEGFCPDGFHPSAIGNAVWAEHLAAAMLEDAVADLASEPVPDAAGAMGGGPR